MTKNTLFDEDDQFTVFNSSQSQSRNTKKQYQLQNILFQIFLLFSILLLAFSLSTIFKPVSHQIASHYASSILYESDDSLAETLTYMKQAEQFQWIKNSEDHDQLPICIGIAAQSKVQTQLIKQSIKRQNYKRYRAFSIHETGRTLKEGNINYFDINKRLKYQCEQNSIVMLLNSAIKGSLLSYLNRVYQTKNIWLTYEMVDGQLLIYSWYQRIFSLVENNDFKKQNRQYLQGPDHEIIAISMIQLALNHAENITKHSYVNELNRDSIIIRVNATHHRKYVRTPYQQLFSLRQDFQVNKFRMENLYKKMLQNKQKEYFAQKVSLTKQKMLNSQLFLELLYLPTNHSIQKYQKSTYQKKYNFTSLTKELPMCICVPSHNNIQNNRYQHVMLSILQQNYQNYHIVFIDDDSTDDTLQQTMKFMKQMRFPVQRISYIKNLRRNFATYNILNAAFNYCGNQEIQVMVDGDDELIGKQVFQLLNYNYQYRDNWLVYTSHITNQYSYGASFPFTGMDMILDSNKKRKKGHFIGHLTTWYVSLLKKINLEDHKMPNGEWYDTLYDDAFQHPLMQMGGTDHIEFIPEITYLYNRNYGDNDDSTTEKIKYRYELYNVLLRKKHYKRIEKLDPSIKNEEVENQIKKGYGERYMNVFDYNVGSLKKKRNLKGSSF